MALITLTGGALWQWDTSRSVAVAGDAAVEVHFALEGAGEAYCTEVTDGVAEIPNVLLVAGRDIVAWASDGANTLGMVRLAVHRRAKPPTYAYSATEIKSVESIAGDVVAEALAALSDYPTSATAVGSGVNPVYVAGGAIAASTETVGGASEPVYLKAGTITSTGYDLSTFATSTEVDEAVAAIDLSGYVQTTDLVAITDTEISALFA